MIFGGTQGTGTIQNDMNVAPWHHTADGNEAATSAPLLAGTLRNFKVVLSAAPGGTASWTVHVQNNAGSLGSCLIAGTATSCTLAGPFGFLDGDRLGVLMDETGVAVATRVAFKADYAFTAP